MMDLCNVCGQQYEYYYVYQYQQLYYVLLLDWFGIVLFGDVGIGWVLVIEVLDYVMFVQQCDVVVDQLEWFVDLWCMCVEFVVDYFGFVVVVDDFYQC